MSIFAKAAALLGLSSIAAQKTPQVNLEIMNNQRAPYKFPTTWGDLSNGPANQAIPAPPSYFHRPSQRQTRKAARRLRHLKN